VSAFRRSNVLIEHVLGEQKPEPGSTWRLRKGERYVVLDVVHDGYVEGHESTSGRRTTIRRDTLIARYVKVDESKYRTVGAEPES
jgi:hypothetical protein